MGRAERSGAAAISQVARLDQAADAQREAIAFVTEIAADSIDVQVRVSIPT